MTIHPFQQRLAELWIIEHGYKDIGGRDLTDGETREMDQCLKLNAIYICKVASLENHSLMAHMTNDIEWQHEICKQIEDLSNNFQTKKRSNAQKHPTKE